MEVIEKERSHQKREKERKCERECLEWHHAVCLWFGPIPSHARARFITSPSPIINRYIISRFLASNTFHHGNLYLCVWKLSTTQFQTHCFFLLINSLFPLHSYKLAIIHNKVQIQISSFKEIFLTWEPKESFNL